MARNYRMSITGTIVAIGGGGFSMSETGESAIDDYLLDLAAMGTDLAEGAAPAGRLPRVCFVPTASADSPGYCDRFEAAFAGRARTEILSLFGQGRMAYQDPKMLLDMDLIYVGGGSTVNLLALWRAHGVDEIMAQAASNGTILAGISAGANCWFDASSTDSFGPLAPLNDGLGFIGGSVCPHYRGEPGRQEEFRDWIRTRALPSPGLGIDDHAAVIFENSKPTSVISERDGSHAFAVTGDNEIRIDAEAVLSGRHRQVQTSAQPHEMPTGL